MRILLLSFLFFSILLNAQITRPIGINLTGIQDWSEEFVFVDVMKQSRDWVTHDLAPGSAWSSDVNIPLRADGYPVEIPYDNGTDPIQGIRTLMYFGELANLYPSGEYHLMVEGTGQIRFWGAASGVFQCPIDTVVMVDNSLGGIALEIESSLISDPVHNIRFVMPGFEDTYETNPFHPELLEFLEDFQTIRFMDWLKTNGSVVQEWSDRNTPGYFTQTVNNGVSYEYLIDLSNRSQKNVWINIPHMASDDFITEFARLLRDQIDPELKIYVEYSNEVWNGIFEQNVYAAEQGLELGYTGEPWERTWKYTAKRSADIFQIFENEFDNDDRLIKVIPGFSANSWVSNYIIDRFNEVEYNPTQITADALAIAPYFGGVANEIGDAGLASTITVSEILDSLEASLPDTYGWIDATKEVADFHNLDMIAYEGGQHLVAYYPYSEDETFVEKLLDANRDPRMEGMYCEYLDYWYDNAEGGAFAHFSSHGAYSKYGSWGVKEHYYDYDSPKYLALINCVFDSNTVISNNQVEFDHDHLKLFPNPAYNFFTVQDLQQGDQLSIYDVNGILQQSHSPNADQITIDVSKLAKGVYFIKIENKLNATIHVNKMLKQ